MLLVQDNFYCKVVIKTHVVCLFFSYGVGVGRCKCAYFAAGLKFWFLILPVLVKSLLPFWEIDVLFHKLLFASFFSGELKFVRFHVYYLAQ